jgi:GDP-fucose transporter C1
MPSFFRFVSITLVFVNKSLLSGAEKLDAPLFVTCYQCIVTVAACYLLK